MIKEIRNAIGEDRVIRVDTNAQWTMATAREAVRRFEPYNVQNFEDPVDTLEGLAKLRPYTRASLSTHNPDLKRAVTLGVPDYFVLNLVELGGIRRTLEFIHATNMMGFGFWFHSGETGIGNSAYLHVGAVVESITEPSQSLFRYMADDVIEEGPHSPRDGYVPVPDGPGLGVTLDPESLARCHQRFLDDGPLPSGDGTRHWLNRAPWLSGPAFVPPSSVTDSAPIAPLGAKVQ
jgi:glucarate dehydratase